MRKSLLLAVASLLLVVASPARAQFCPGVSPWVFDDVAASDPFCGYITWMAENGISLGCQIVDANHRLYCPADNVSRKQMAAFINRLGNIRVEAVGTGPGLTGGPITSTGTINLAPTQLLPTTPCTSGQMPLWTGTAWACGNASGGTVTSVATGPGLTGGPVTSSGTISADTTYLQRRVSSSCTVGSAISAINADGTVLCQSVGSVTSVATGTGLAGGPITGTGTVSIAPGGVDTAQLAGGAVNKTKLSAVGGTTGQSLTTDGANLVWQTVPQVVTWRGVAPSIAANSTAFVFVGPTGIFTVPAGQNRQVTVANTAALGLASGAAVEVFVNVCYQPSGGPVLEFGAGTYSVVSVSTNRAIYAVSSSNPLGAGTYGIGFCVKNVSSVAINSNDWTSGWAMVTAF